ncbi:B-cell receptor CD22-like [Periophthalmus magnuspinnatus]|uniref:B-cell receptor CD22-like n=1 Tax=Periophthalmus magnuspinnatus TaxID=409849 RepID=UPI0024367A6C|nr:B-cell receptor CD22-like [Periophthalmus magnuspinnatus]
METIFFFSALFLSGVWASCERNPKLIVTAPTKELKALTGSCLQIPCTFRPEQGQTMDYSKKIYGIWIKHDPRIEFADNIIFNSSGARTKYPMKIIGNMSQKNCTTLFSNLTTQHTNKYYFRVENEAFKATASCQTIQVTVKDSWSPTIQVSGKQTETEVVTITCSAVTPCPHAPPQLTWDLHQGTAHITETNADGTFTTKLTQKVTLAQSHDRRQIKCTAAYRVDGEIKMAANTIKLNVTYGPKNTSVEVSPSGSLSAGQTVTLSCSSRAKPPVHHFTWFRHSSQGPANVSQGHTYSFNFSKASHGEYYCEAWNKVGKQQSQVMHVGPGGVKAASSSSQSMAIAGGIIGILLVVIVIFFIWRFKLKHKPSQQTRSLTTAQIPADINKHDEVHYGQIDFSKFTHESKGQPVQDKNQETVYSAVKVSNMADGSSIYTPVKN